MGDSDDDMVDAEDAQYYQKRLNKAVFLLREHGREPEDAAKEKKARKIERKREREELDAAEDAPRKSRDWQKADLEQRSLGLPIKMPDGSMKKTKLDAPLPENEDPDTLRAPLTDSMRKRMRKKARAEGEEAAAAAGGEGGAAAKGGKQGESRGQGGGNAPQKGGAGEGPAPQQGAVEPKGAAAGGGAGEASSIQKKMAMGQMCASLLRDPEGNITSLRQIVGFTKDADKQVVKLATLSLAAVFVDIIPGYRIRLPTEKELQMKVSKQVAQQRKFETTLLQEYQKFLQFLESMGRKHEDEAAALSAAGDASGSTTLMCVQCVARLLTAHPHFNFAGNIVTSLVRRLESPVEEVFSAAHAAIATLLEGQVADERVRECVGLIAELVKRKMSKVRPQVLALLLHLRISGDMLEGTGKKKKKRGEEAEEDEEGRQLEADLREGTAEVNRDDLKEAATKVLDTIFVCYFRVLKMDPAEAHPLLPPVLQGLARFAHLINVDFFSDLMQAIKQLVAADEGGRLRLSLESAVHCVLCVFRCLKSQGEVWDLDLQDFYDILFDAVPRVCQRQEEAEGGGGGGDGEESVGLLIEALTVTLWDTRQLSTDRVAGFAKRLMSVSAHLTPPKAIPVMSLCRKLLTRYPRVKRLVDTDASSVGVYNPDVRNAELSHALASTAWELCALGRSYHPDLARAAREIAGIAEEGQQEEELFRAMVTARNPESLLRAYSTDAGGFHPPITPPSTHPLTALREKRERKLAKGGGAKRGEARELYPAVPAHQTPLMQAVGRAEGQDAAARRALDDGQVSDSLMRLFEASGGRQQAAVKPSGGGGGGAAGKKQGGAGAKGNGIVKGAGAGAGGKGAKGVQPGVAGKPGGLNGKGGGGGQRQNGNKAHIQPDKVKKNGKKAH